MPFGFLANAPPPVDDPIAQVKREEFKARKGVPERPDPQEGRITRTWLDFFVSLIGIVERASVRRFSASADAEEASIGATDITDGTLPGGLYRFSYYASITQAAGTSSSLEVTLDWTDEGNAKAYTGAAITSNVVTASQSAVLLIRSDSGAPVRYSTTYASTGGLGVDMAYDLSVVLEQVEA
jgi:hypothetical protein